MRVVPGLLVMLLLPLMAADCNKDDASAAYSSAYIGFATDSGYTYRNDTVGLSDTLRVGLRIQQNDDDLRTLYIDAAYDGGAAVRKDSLHIPSASFDTDRFLIMRDHAGQEKWTFTVEAADGDRVKRSLTFTVQ